MEEGMDSTAARAPTVWIGYEGVPYEGYGEPLLLFASKEAAHEWAAEKSGEGGNEWREVIEFPVTGGEPLGLEQRRQGKAHYFSKGRCEVCTQETCDHDWKRLDGRWVKPRDRCTKCGLDRWSPEPAK